MKRLVSIILVLAILFSISCFADSLGHSAMLKALPELKNLETIISKQGDEGKAWNYDRGNISSPFEKSHRTSSFYADLRIVWSGDDYKPYIYYTQTKEWDKDSEYEVTYSCTYKFDKMNKYIIEWARNQLKEGKVKSVDFEYGFWNIWKDGIENSQIYKNSISMTCRSLEDFDIFAEVFLNKCK